MNDRKRKPPPDRPDDPSPTRRKDPRPPYPVERPDLDDRRGAEPDVVPDPGDERPRPI